jgi:hypothetical protein
MTLENAIKADAELRAAHHVKETIFRCIEREGMTRNNQAALAAVNKALDKARDKYRPHIAVLEAKS